MGISKLVLLIATALAMIAVLVPTIHKDLWVYRIFDYPRLQKFVIIGVLLALWIFFFHESRTWPDLLAMGCLSISFLYLGYLIVPFTPLGKKMIYEDTAQDDRQVMTVLVANVYQYNKSYKKLLDLIKVRDPDVVFIVETDQVWLDNLKEIKQEYPHSIEIPKDNTYGLLFYSKLPVLHSEINYLIDDEIPSIIADVAFSDKQVRIYGLHPAPPVPQESMHSTDRDAEILLVGKMAKKHNGPCMVIGDLNDVAWSYTTNLFLKTSGLLDPRHGRGLYSTFHAKYPLLRWPLDHFFVSNDFHLKNIKVEKSIDSDHFPISIQLVFCKVDDSDAEKADSEDRELASEKISRGLNNDPK
ncbi:MAG: endonuclease/exonuclease/phosphatase family protein [Flavobacterium sp.]|nr:endonuclease/exonuclease/phosphatase family protein [Flavobacterium sp.]